MFSMHKTGVMILQMTNYYMLHMYRQVLKKVCQAFSIVYISFSKNHVHLACAEF